MGKPFQFHDGLVLPKGSCLAFPALAIQKDLENFEEPLVFDGFRFARLHSSERDHNGDEFQANASTISPTYLA